MSTTNIGNITQAGISPTIPSVNSDTNKKEQAEEIIGQSFYELMNQSTPEGTLAQGRKAAASTAGVSGDAGVKQDYTKLQNTSNTSKVKTAETNKPDFKNPTQEVKSTVDQAIDQAKEVVKSELGVTDEDIEEALAEEGLLPVDFFEPQFLVQIIAELTNTEDPADLLADPAVADLLAQVGEITEQVAGALDMNVEEAIDFIGEMGDLYDTITFEEAQATIITGDDVSDIEPPSDYINDDQPVDFAQAVAESEAQQLEDVDTAPAQAAAVAQETEVEEEAPAQPNRVAQVRPAAEAQRMERPVQETEEAQETDAKAPAQVRQGEDPQAQSGNQNAPRGGQQNPQQSLTRTTAQAAPESVRVPSEHVTVTPDNIPTFDAAMEAAAMPDQFSYIDADNLIQQFAELTRNYQTGATSLSMHLDPENLGNLTLNVTSDRNGAVSAQIRVESDAVRDTLNAQIAQVRATLESAGIRVTSVEVTVETHEFEQAYENQRDLSGGMERDGRDRRAQQENETIEGAGARRNLDINNLEEIADNMTEEERLAANIMRDNGGSVDYTA